MTLRVARVTFRAGAWTRRRDGLAALPVEMFVQDGISMSPAIDLARELAKLTRLVYGEDVIPEDALPAGVLTPAAARHVKAGFVVALDANQPQPLYVEGNAMPDTAHLNLTILQPMTADLDDQAVLLQRRAAVVDALATLNGPIGT